VPALLLHLHLEYAETRGLLKDKRWKLAVLFLFYAACLHVAVHRIPLLLQDPQFNFLVPGSSLGEGFAIVLAVALVGAVAGKDASRRPPRISRSAIFTGCSWIFRDDLPGGRWLAFGPVSYASSDRRRRLLQLRCSALAYETGPNASHRPPGRSSRKNPKSIQ